MLFFGSKKKKLEVKDEVFCPYCQKEIKPEDVLFFEEKQTPDPDPVFEETIKRYLSENVQVENSHYGEVIKLDDAKVRKIEKNEYGYPDEIQIEMETGYNKSITNRICHRCHCYLPNDFEALEYKNIAIMGDTSCGKTTFIAAMLNELCGLKGEDDNPNRVAGGTQWAQFRLEKDSVMFASSLVNNMKDGVRVATDVETPLFPMVITMTPQDTTLESVILIIHDFAGEGMARADYMASHPLSNNIDGLMILFDSCQLKKLDSLNVEFKCQIDPSIFFSSMNNRIKNSIKKAQSVAVVLNKFDLLNIDRDIEVSGMVIHSNITDDHKDGISKSVVQNVGASIRKILQDDSNMATKIEKELGKKWSLKNLPDIAYFGVSSMKYDETEDENGHKLYTNKYKPGETHRLLEPILYILAKLDKLKVIQ